MKKLLSLLLAALLAASLILPAGAAFVDVGESRWYAGSVDYVTSRGLFQGVGGGKFDPYGAMTRGMFVLVLSRVAKADVSGAPGAGFADVRPDKYYADAVNWAARNGYAPGRSSGSFAPEEAITREEIAVVLYNYLSKTGTVLEPDPAAPASFGDFADVSADARAAVEYVRWMGLMNGSGGKFDPAGALDRAQAAEVFMRLSQRLEGAQASDWHVTNPVLVLETSTQDASPAYGGGREWGKVLVTDPYNGIKDGTAFPDYGYKFQVSDESVVRVGGWSELCAPRQLAPGAEPVRAVITITRPVDGSQRQMLVVVTARAAQVEEDPAPSARPEPDVEAFTVTTPSFDEITTIYADVSGSSIGQIRITDPYWNITDKTINASYGYTFSSSDISVVDVNERGILINARLLAPGDEPIHATITVTNKRDGHSVQVPVTISPDPRWYTFDDDYIAAFAAESLRLTNEYRAQAVAEGHYSAVSILGETAQPLSYAYEAQECIDVRSKWLTLCLGHESEKVAALQVQYGFTTEATFFGGENLTARLPLNVSQIKSDYPEIGNGGVEIDPESLAQELMSSFTRDEPHYNTMVLYIHTEMCIGLYHDTTGFYCACWYR